MHRQRPYISTELLRTYVNHHPPYANTYPHQQAPHPLPNCSLPTPHADHIATPSQLGTHIHPHPHQSLLRHLHHPQLSKSPPNTPTPHPPRFRCIQADLSQRSPAAGAFHPYTPPKWCFSSFQEPLKCPKCGPRYSLIPRSPVPWSFVGAFGL